LGKGERMRKTDMNLMSAFAGESQTNRKYLAFAAQADKEGYPRTAPGSSETIHAHGHLNAFGGIGSTKENLKEVIASKKMYM